MQSFSGKSEMDGKSLTGKRKLFFKSEYWRNRIAFWLLVSSLLANVVNWAILPIFVRPTVSTIILHYNVYFGVDAMGDWKWVFILPGIGFFLLIVNNFLAMYFYANKERIASYVLLIGALMVQLCLLIASISVIIINY